MIVVGCLSFLIGTSHPLGHNTIHNNWVTTFRCYVSRSSLTHKNIPSKFPSAHDWLFHQLHAKGSAVSGVLVWFKRQQWSFWVTMAVFSCFLFSLLGFLCRSPPSAKMADEAGTHDHLISSPPNGPRCCPNGAWDHQVSPFFVECGTPQSKLMVFQ